MSSEKSIPVLDLALVKEHREELVADIKHALIFWGFFYVVNYDDLIDANIIQLVIEQGDKFFDGPEDYKDEIDIIRSKTFSGYQKTHVGDISVENVYAHHPSNKDQLIGPNNYPTKPPLFQQSIEQLIEPVQIISELLNGLILESLSSNHNSSKFTPKINYSDIHLFRSRQDSSQPIEAQQQSFDLFQYIFGPPTLSVCDAFGSWVDSPAKPNQIAISAGPILEYFTRNVYISGKFKFIDSNGNNSKLHYKSFYDLNTNFQQCDIPEELELERQHRDKIPTRHSSIKFDKQATLGNSILNEKILNYKNVSHQWYPEILQNLEKRLNQQNLSDSKNNHFLIESIEKTKAIFNNFDKTVPHLVRNRTSDISLSDVMAQMKNLTGFTITEQDLLKVATIWVDPLCFKLNEYDDIVIDSDNAKSEFQYKNFAKRKKTFDLKCEQWLSENKYLNDIPLYSKDKLEAPNFTSKTKRLKKEILQNSKDRFIAKPKTEVPETKGLSLLERIKLKERQASESKITPEVKYNNFLEGKLRNVLKIVLSLKPNTPYDVSKLSETLQNSITKNPIGEKEAYDCTLYLNKKFPETFKLVETPNSKILKWGELNRGELLSKLQN